MNEKVRTITFFAALASLFGLGVWLLLSPNGSSVVAPSAANAADHSAENPPVASTQSAPKVVPEPGVSNSCLACEARACANEYQGCSALTGSAVDGSLKGTSRVQLCQDVLACVRKSGCAPGARGVGHECYCGSDDVQKCITEATPHGPCKDVIEAAAESFSPMVVGQRWGKAEFAVGAAFRRIRCEAQRCRAECFPGAKPEAK